MLSNGKDMACVGGRLTLIWILPLTLISCVIFDKVLRSFTVEMEINLPCKVFKED